MFTIATDQGAFRWGPDGHALNALGLQDTPLSDIVASKLGDRIAAIGRGRDFWQRHGDAAWVRVSLPDDGIQAASLLMAADDDTLTVGTEPPALYRKRWDATEWELVCALHQLPMARDWHTPWGGPPAVRALAAREGPGVLGTDQLYLDIHVGGILRTTDAGRNWEPVNRGLELDVHQVATHRLAPSRVYAATADGFYLSEDEGATWERRNDGLTNLYCRGIAIHPQRPDVVLISGSPTAPPRWRQAGPRFALFRTMDAGRTWSRIESLDPGSAVINTRGIAFSRHRPDVALCAAGTSLWESDDAGATWRRVEARAPEVYAVTG